MIFGMCNICVIQRRNVIYLYNKKSHLDQLFHCQFPDMMSLGELQISFPLFFCTKNSPNDIISGTLTVKKLINISYFVIKIHYISSQNDPNITHTKNYIWG
jgi:hypothetical protein